MYRIAAYLALALVAGSAASRAAAEVAPEAVDGPVFTYQQIASGIVMTARDCATYRRMVYVVVQGVGLCFRYHLSTTGGPSNEATYSLSGDVSGASAAYTPGQQDRAAEVMSRRYGMPAVYLARMGMDGSSGWHIRNRRTWFEVEATNLAINAINARHGFLNVHIMGHSGGGHLVASLLGIRRDLRCVLIGSGFVAFPADYAARQARKDPARRHYDPRSALPMIVRNSLQARIIVLTDPKDRLAPPNEQTPFVRDVRQTGGRIAQFFFTAGDADHHGSRLYMRAAMDGCIRGVSDQEIEIAVARLSEATERERTAAGQPQAGARPPSASSPLIPSNPPARVEIQSRPVAQPVQAGPIAEGPNQMGKVSNEKALGASRRSLIGRP